MDVGGRGLRLIGVTLLDAQSRAGRRRRLDAQTPLDEVEARRVRLQHALQVVEPLDELFEDFPRR